MTKIGIRLCACHLFRSTAVTDIQTDKFIEYMIGYSICLYSPSATFVSTPLNERSARTIKTQPLFWLMGNCQQSQKGQQPIDDQQFNADLVPAKKILCMPGQKVRKHRRR